MARGVGWGVGLQLMRQAATGAQGSHWKNTCHIAHHRAAPASTTRRVGFAWAALAFGSLLWGAAWAVHRWPHVLMLGAPP